MLKIDITRKKFIAVFLIGLLMGFIFGFIIGFEQGAEITIKKVVDVASGFVTIDEAMVKQAIGQYNGHIKNCYPSNWSVRFTPSGFQSYSPFQ